MTNIAALPAFSATFEIFAGEDWRDGWCYAFPDGSVCDLAGIGFTLNVGLDGAAPLLTFTSANKKIVVLGGILAICVTAADLTTLPPGGYRVGVVATGDGETIALMDGYLTLIGSA